MLALFEKVKAGFSGTGSVARQFVGDMSKLATDFFMDARMYEAQLDSTDTQVLHTAVAGLQERVNELFQQAPILEDKYQHSKVSFNTILVTMCQEICDFATQASRHLCNEYKHCTFDRIAQDHVYMDVTPFVSNMIQNICTFNTLLTSHQLGWSVVSLQIMMVPILRKAALTPCHLEFVEYLTEQSLHVQWSIRRPSTTLAPWPSGVNLESDQENAGSSKPKASDPDSPMMQPAPQTDEPLTPSKPPEMPTKPQATPSKPQVMPIKPQTMPLKHPLTPKKATPGSSDGTKDIMDRIAAKYGAGMSPQYSNVLALLISGKGSKAAFPKDTESGPKGDHSYIKLTRTDSDSDDPKKVEPPAKKYKHDPGSGPDTANARFGSAKKKPKKGMKKTPKSKKTVSESKSSNDAETMCGKLRSQPNEEEISKRQSWHTNKWSADLPGIHSYHQHKGIIPENPPAFSFKDHSDYLHQLLQMNELRLNIMPISELLAQYKKDTSATSQKRYEALRMLSSSTMGKSSASPLYVVFRQFCY